MEAIELDVCFVRDGEMVVGETYPNGALKVGKGASDVASRLVLAAQALTVDRISCNEQENWSSEPARAVNRALEDVWTTGRKPVMQELESLRLDA
jgi:hypothetical protein